MTEETRIITAEITLVGSESRNENMAKAVKGLAGIIADSVVVIKDQRFEMEKAEEVQTNDIQ